MRCVKMLMHVGSPGAKDKAVQLLKSGEIIAVPTDTIYGLACSAVNREAIKRLYEVKSRSESKPLAICMSSVKNMANWAKVDHLPNGMLSELLPGKVTVVLQCVREYNEYITSSDGKIGIRVPDNAFVRDVVSSFGDPIALTSANVSGETSALNVDEFEPLWKDLAGVFDQGDLGRGNEQRSGSTVVDLSFHNGFCVLRNGIALEHVMKVLRKYRLKNHVMDCFHVE